MSLLTSLLKLFKWNTTDETDLEQEFDIDKAMNDNWDKLDDFAERVNDAVIEIQDDIEEIQNKNTEQDETINTINESISSIQAKDESQDTEIDKQSDLIQKLKDNSINVTTEEATQLQVQDASTLPAKLDVRGNHSQETREGYNVLQNKLTSTTINGVAFTINEDKSITLNGTATNSIIANLLTGQYNDNNATSPLIIPDNITNYRLSGCPSGGSWSTYKLDIYAEDNELIATDLGEGANIQKESDTILNLLRVRIIVYAGAVLNNVTFYPMIIYGAENKPYEQYGASPSLDYPSEVRAVGDNVNLFDVWESGTISNSGNIESSDIAIRTADFISVKSNTSYTYKIYDETISNIALFEYDENSNFIKVMYNLNTEQTIVTSETTRKVKMRIVSTDLSTKMKFEEGEEATAYSPYGQGSVEIKKINSNIMPILELDTYWRYTEKGIQNIEGNTGHTITSFELKKGQTIKIGFIVFSKPSENTTFTCQINNIENSSLNIGRFNNFNLNQKYEFSYTAMEDVVFKYVLNGNSANEIFEFQLWANIENLEDYQRYEESSYNLPIQKPMLSGDYFVKETDGWKEVHGWNKEFFANIINNAIISSSNMHMTIPNFSNNKALLPSNSEIANIFSNVFKPVAFANIDKVDYGIGIYYASDSLVIRNKDYATLQDYKNSLNNEDFYFYYKLATPTKLACTEAQSKVLDQLNELDLFKGTNNIITAESLALMQMQYIADTQSYIDSKLNNINQQILELAGGN